MTLESLSTLAILGGVVAVLLVGTLLALEPDRPGDEAAEIGAADEGSAGRAPWPRPSDGAPCGHRSGSRPAARRQSSAGPEPAVRHKS